MSVVIIAKDLVVIGAYYHVVCKIKIVECEDSEKIYIVDQEKDINIIHKSHFTKMIHLNEKKISVYELESLTNLKIKETPTFPDYIFGSNQIKNKTGMKKKYHHRRSNKTYDLSVLKQTYNRTTPNKTQDRITTTLPDYVLGSNATHNQLKVDRTYYENIPNRYNFKPKNAKNKTTSRELHDKKPCKIEAIDQSLNTKQNVKIISIEKEDLKNLVISLIKNDIPVPKNVLDIFSTV